MRNDEPLIVISTDGHCGADVLGYRPYLESKYHEEFDAWAAAYTDPWGVIDADVEDEDYRIGPASFASSVNWDSGKRLSITEENGIAAEILFPNTAPPFFPSGAISAHTPADAAELERRAVGLRAHNRWLAEFCADAPGRRGGIAQMFFKDVDAAVREIRWAKENGLFGVLLPSDHMLQLSNLYYPRLDPIWAVCAELDFPVIRHQVVPSEAAGPEAGDAAPIIGFAETQFFTNRPITHLILSGVFDRHPKLKLVITENDGGSLVLPQIQMLDYLVKDAATDNTIMSLFSKDMARALKKTPSEYYRQHVYHGTFITSDDIENRYRVGVDRMMFGADLPHHEGTHPFTREALRLNLSGLPDDEIRAICYGTAVECYGFDPKVLQPIADRIGPTLEQIKVPLSGGEISEDAAPFCPSFQGGEDWLRPAP